MVVVTVPLVRKGPALALARELVEREDTEVVEVGEVALCRRVHGAQVTRGNRDSLRRDLLARLAGAPLL